MSRNNRRLVFIDVARGLAIIFVILGHININSKLHCFIYSFHMPCFFILSGITTDFLDRNKIKKYNYSLLISYLFWSILFLFYDFFIRIFVLKRSMHLMAIRLIDFISFDGISVLWFLPTLLICNLIVFFFVRCFNKKFIIVGVLLFFHVLSVWLSKNYSVILLKDTYISIYLVKVYTIIVRSFSICIFVYIGYICKEKILFISEMDKKRIKLYIISFLLFILVYLLSQINNKVDIHSIVFGKNETFFLFNAVIGTFSVLLLSTCLEKNIFGKIFAYLGSNSLFIMATHLYLPVISVVNFFVSKLDVRYNYLEILIKIIFILSIEFFLIEVFGKKLKIYNKRLTSFFQNKQIFY